MKNDQIVQQPSGEHAVAPKRILGDLVTVGFALMIALLIVGGLARYTSMINLAQSNRWVTHTYRVVNELEIMLSFVKDAESGQRGYLLTDDKTYLVPYEESLTHVREQIFTVRNLTSDNPQQQERLAKLETLVNQKVDELRKTVALADQGDRQGALNMVRSGLGKGLMHEIRLQVNEMQKSEQTLLELQTDESKSGFQLAMLSLILPTILGFVLMVVTFYLFQRNNRERQRASTILFEQKERFRTTLASIGDGVITTDTQGKVTNLNTVAIDLTGWSNAEALGKPLIEVFDIVNETTRKTVENPVTRSLREGRIVGLANHTVLIARDRTERFIDDSASPIRAQNGDVIGCVLIFRDISEHKHIENERVATAARIASVVDHVVDGIVTVNEAGIIESFNPAAEQLFGYQASEVIGQSITMLMPESARIIRDQNVTEGLRKRTESVGMGREVEGLRKDGSRFPMELGVSEFTLGEKRFFTALVHDVTERKLAEQNLRKMAAELSESDRKKDEFIAILAHELRNPLAPIRNGLQIMRLSADHHAVEEARTMMERQLAHMIRLVDDLLDVSRISRGKLVLQKRTVELAAVLRNAAETSRPVIESNGQHLIFDLPADPVYLDADVTRLGQVFANLLNNASKYSDRGSPIHVSAIVDGSQIVVKVKDSGIGIPAEMLPKIFEMFTQIDRTIERSQGGLGIGLSLVKRLTEMHGGTVEAASEGPSHGSELIVRLPIAPIQTPPPPVESKGVPPVSSRRILVADDNEDSATTLAMMLKFMGNQVRTAGDGRAAVQISQEYRPDVILLDIGMPELNGYEACRHIRAQEWGKEAVIIALTGWGQDEDKRRSEAAGFDHHLVKPVDPDLLERLLGQIQTR